MRILMCAAAAPLPPLNGTRLVVWNLCRELSKKHELTLLAFRWPDQYGEAPDGLTYRELPVQRRSLPVRTGDRVISLIRQKPVEVDRLGGRMRLEIARLRATRSFDVAHVIGGTLADVAGALKGLPAIIAPLDAWGINTAADVANARGLRRAWLRMQERIVQRYTAHAYRPFATTVLVSDADAASVALTDPAISTSVITIGVDCDRFTPRDDIMRDRRLILFTGTLWFPPNVMAAKFLAGEVLLLVRRKIPDARLVIAGRDPGEDVLALGRQPNVSVFADVPDLRPLLAEAGVFACGMTHGTGTKIKLLEAMASGAPAVSTTLGSRGLAVNDGRELLIADGPDAFAAAVVRLLDAPAFAEHLGREGRRYVVAQHTWAAVATRYEALYESARGR
jgi:glycosyltransferase involved in cell wall biosynthesis